MCRAEWMNGICLVWSRGRLISPFLPVGDDRYLNLSSQKRPTGRSLGGNRLLRRSGTTSRGTVVLVFCLRMRSFPLALVLTIFVSWHYSLLYQNSPTPWICVTSLGWSTTVFGRRLTVHTKQVSRYNRYIENISPNVGTETNGSNKTWIGKNDRRHQPSQSSILL